MRSKQPEPRYLAIGRVLRPHGVRGELRMELLTDYPERLASLKTVYVGEGYEPHQVLGARLHKKQALLQLEGYEDRNAVEDLRGALIFVTVEDAVPLEVGEYWEHQVEGLEVVTDEDMFVGEVAEVLSVPGSNDVLVVHGPLGEVLIPVIEEVMTSIDLEAGRIVIHPLPGLLGDA